ncbi:type II toxin-antitoxin system HicB family antitoxin [Desulfosporosinus sp. Sb-LF]|uniref:type II toxin-antitoxin system HicB family antitoxin n=1 Tax=Desulfosporosinus sp. Sb-LF TaxID=2560027 RepID=UPI00107F570F|nr:type II toxin-antitoxin system HicB family antitoxin [Desulfosporosinus sp. Sb-LF]TGE33698.1 type II toxin-antitoxin system HicB family antitoxin [Desulfosporosinus sp. Sb-LF]
MKNRTLIASPLDEEGLWLAEIPEVKGCKTQGKDLLEVIQRAEELREALDTINGLQFMEEEQTEDEQEKNDFNVLGYFVSHKNKSNGSICSDISEVLGIIEEFDNAVDRGNKAFRRHLGIMMTHLSLEISTLSIGPWTIQCKSMKRQLDTAPKWDGWKDKWNGDEETA